MKYFNSKDYVNVYLSKDGKIYRNVKEYRLTNIFSKYPKEFAPIIKFIAADFEIPNKYLSSNKTIVNQIFKEGSMVLSY